LKLEGFYIILQNLTKTIPYLKEELLSSLAALAPDAPEGGGMAFDGPASLSDWHG
jgi:hypothetical protein